MIGLDWIGPSRREWVLAEVHRVVTKLLDDPVDTVWSVAADEFGLIVTSTLAARRLTYDLYVVRDGEIPMRLFPDQQPQGIHDPEYHRAHARDVLIVTTDPYFSIEAVLDTRHRVMNDVSESLDGLLLVGSAGTRKMFPVMHRMRNAGIDIIHLDWTHRVTVRKPGRIP